MIGEDVLHSLLQIAEPTLWSTRSTNVAQPLNNPTYTSLVVNTAIRLRGLGQSIRPAKRRCTNPGNFKANKGLCKI